MRIYIYAVIDSSNGIDESIYGLEGSSVYNIPYGDLGAVASKLNGKVENIKIDVLEHERVIERLMGKFTVLPFKFHTLFNEEDDVFSLMKGYYANFRENLDRVRNKAEFGLKVIWSGDKIKESIRSAYKKDNQREPLSGDSPGKSFIMEKFEEYKLDKCFQEEADRYIAVVDDFLSGFAAEKKLEKLKSENLLLNASYLVEKERESDFKESFEKLRNKQPQLKYLFTGPWPPYNFVTLQRSSTACETALLHCVSP